MTLYCRSVVSEALLRMTSLLLPHLVDPIGSYGRGSPPALRVLLKFRRIRIARTVREGRTGSQAVEPVTRIGLFPEVVDHEVAGRIRDVTIPDRIVLIVKIVLRVKPVIENSA